MGCGASAGPAPQEPQAPQEFAPGEEEDLEKAREKAKAMTVEQRRAQIRAAIPEGYPEDKCIGGCNWIYYPKGKFPHPHMSAHMPGFFDIVGPARGDQLGNWKPEFDEFLCLSCWREEALQNKASRIVEAPLSLMRMPSTNLMVVSGLSKEEDVEAEMARFEIWQKSKDGKCAICDGAGFIKVDEENAGKGEPLDCGCCQKCWICNGDGTNAGMFSSGLKDYEPEERDDDKLCNICFCSSRYKMSDECEHFYCSECIGHSLKAILAQGQFPALCPACRAEEVAGGEMNPTKGPIKYPSLTFFARRGVIDRDLCFRFMLQQLETEGVTFFKCPANECGNWLRHENPGQILRVEGEKIIRVPKIGVAPCGASVCLVCHLEVQRNWMTPTNVEMLSVDLHIRAKRPDIDEDYVYGKVLEVVEDPPGAKIDFKDEVEGHLDIPVTELENIQIKTDEYLHECAEDVATDDLQKEAAMKATAEALAGLGCKPCPMCGVLTQKSLGCNYMKCQHCKGEWCWEMEKPRRPPPPEGCGGGHNCH